MSTRGIGWQQTLETGTFEEVLASLESIVASLEQGHQSLKDSVDLYELGMKLALRCEHLLNNAELRIREIEREAGFENRVNPIEDLSDPFNRTRP